jgi:hypothetical protein
LGLIWWNSKTWCKLDEHLVNFQNLVNIWCISKTWWIPKPGKRPGEFPKTWWTCRLFWKRDEHLVKPWWMPKPGENLVKTWWKLGENLVKTWWIHQVFTRFLANKQKKRFAHWRILVKRLLHSTPEMV